jgi:hypothetical protein
MASLEQRSFSNIITFTRASNATYFDSTGIIKSATTNTPRFDYNPVTLALRGILVEEQRTNLSVYSETFSTGWAPVSSDSQIIPNAVSSPSGAENAGSFVCTNTNTSSKRLQTTANITTVANTTYTFTVYIKSLNWQWVNVGVTATVFAVDGFSATFDVQNGALGTATQSLGTGTFSSRSITSVGNGWYRISITGILSTSNTSFRPKITLASATGSGIAVTPVGVVGAGVYVWGSQLEAGDFATSYVPSSVTFSGRTSNGTYFDSAGTLRTAGSGVARTTYTPSNLSADPFLLLEESRTNSILNNTMTGTVAGVPGTLPTTWSGGASSPELRRSIVGTGTEQGIPYIDVVFAGSFLSSITYDIYFGDTNSVAATNGQTWTLSSFIKSMGESINITSINLLCDIYTSAPLFSSTLINKAITPNSSNLNVQRYSATGTISDASAAYALPFIRITAGSGGLTYLSLRIGLPQFELGSFTTSPIQTTSAAVTRAADTSTSAAATRSADVASINTSNAWYNENEGTIYAESSRYALGSAGQLIVAEFGSSASDNDNLIQLGTQFAATNFQFLVNSGGVNQAAIVEAGTTETAKYAAAYKLNDFAYTKNGATPTVDTSGTIPAVVKLNIGSRPAFGSTGFLNGHIRRVTYYPRRLTNAELQALTT